MKQLIYIAVILLACSSAVGQDRQIRIITQPSWPPGEYVPVRVEIKNPGLKGFARFYQDLPQGFSTEKGETAGADFYWENRQVNFVWVKMPAEELIRLSYLAKADESLTGSFRLGGKLNYVAGGKERRTIEIEPLTVRLDSKATVDEDITKIFQKEAATNKKCGDDNVNDDIPQKVVFRVQIAISSEQVTKAELEERIGCPLRYSLTVLKTANMYKYQCGAFRTYQEASAFLEEMKEKAVSDAFIVAYRGDEQISTELARTLTVN